MENSHVGPILSNPPDQELSADEYVLAPYCMHSVSHFHSILVTMSSPNIHLSPELVPNQNSTCSTPMATMLQGHYHYQPFSESL